MTVRVNLRLVGTFPGLAGKPEERILDEYEAEEYPPKDFDRLILNLIENAMLAVGQTALSQSEPVLAPV